MRPQGLLLAYPKEITIIVTQEGEKVAGVNGLGFFGRKMTIQKAQWEEIGKLMGWKLK